MATSDLADIQKIKELPPTRLVTMPAWPSCPSPLPLVDVRLSCTQSHIQLLFSISEYSHSFRMQYLKDGDPVWQDSCVEIFIRHPQNNHLYTNVECNARGVCLVEEGCQRQNRRQWSASEYAELKRTVLQHPLPKESLINWEIYLEIPVYLVGCKNNALEQTWWGNLYKCGQHTGSPHWLAKFPLSSANPDFHRPQDFGIILSPAKSDKNSLH